MSENTLPCPLREAATDTPNSPSLITSERNFSFADLDLLVSAVATQLRRRNLVGRRIGLLLDSDWPYVAIMLGIIRAGAVACPISTRLPTAGVRDRLRKLAAAALITDRAGYEQAVPPEQVLVLPAAREAELVDLEPDRPATIVFTSGSTGEPDAALHSFGNHYYSAAGSNENIQVGLGDRWLLSLPLYHVGGIAILFRCLLGRATVLIADSGISIEKQASGATHVSMVATQLYRFLQSRTDNTDLRAVLLGGSAIPDTLIVEASRRGLPIHTSYGLTEMASQVSATPAGADLDLLRTSGHVLPHREVRVVDSGEILVRGRTRFLGYMDGERLIRPFDDDGWYRTGDLGYVDADGALRVTGRRDNLFISGGENIQPEAIEAALSKLPDIAAVVVVPVSDSEFGHRPVAFLRCRGSWPDESALRAAVEAELPRYMVPVAFHRWPDDEAPGRMKIDRQSLRRRAEAQYRSG